MYMYTVKHWHCVGFVWPDLSHFCLFHRYYVLSGCIQLWYDTRLLGLLPVSLPCRSLHGTDKEISASHLLQQSETKYSHALPNFFCYLHTIVYMYAKLGILIILQITGNLVRQQLKVSEEYIHTLDMNMPHVIEGVEVILLDANQWVMYNVYTNDYETGVIL